MNFQTVRCNGGLITAGFFIASIKLEVKTAIGITRVRLIHNDGAIRPRQFKIEQNIGGWLGIVFDPSLQHDGFPNGIVCFRVFNNRLRNMCCQCITDEAD